MEPHRRAAGSQRGQPRPAVQRDANGRISVAPNWESLTERLIREAQERGDFDDLPNHGQPLAVADNPYAGELALAMHVLRNAGIAPPWIEADKEVRRLIEERDEVLRSAPGASPIAHAKHRRELTRIVAAHAEAVARLNAEAPSTRQHRRPMVLTAELAKLELAWRSPRAAG
jgi:hypothetical protein